MVDPVFLAQGKRLMSPDRVELINELWDSIDADDLPVTQGLRRSSRSGSVRPTLPRSRGKRSRRSCAPG
jgi:hypothetical protein